MVSFYVDPHTLLDTDSGLIQNFEDARVLPLAMLF
jgi:hypothetical protein